jgi:hypothetical protein
MMEHTYQYPGVDLPLTYLRCNDPAYWDALRYGTAMVPTYVFGSSQSNHETKTPILPVREVAMMMVMDALTDKPNWHTKIEDETIVAKWRQEALTQDEMGLWTYIVPESVLRSGFRVPKKTRLISEKAFDYVSKQAGSNLDEAADVGCGGQCIQELKQKAQFFQKTGLIYTLNADANAVIKSDSLVSYDLHNQFQLAFKKLQAEQQADPLWHPGTDTSMVQDLVHPSWYPFVYGEQVTTTLYRSYWYGASS